MTSALPQRIAPVVVDLPPRRPSGARRIDLGDAVELLPLDGAVGPEDVAFDNEGRIYTGVRIYPGVDGGAILRMTPGSDRVDLVANTGGRVLGVEPHPDGFVVCDAERGVFMLDPHRSRLDLLVDRVDTEPLRFANNAAIATDGTIYFSQSTTRYDFAASLAEEFEAVPSGRLLAHHPGTGVTEVLATDLNLANGVAVLPGGDAVVVAESLACRLRHVCLSGDQRGTASVLDVSLPGYPDNACTSSDGSRTWVALPAKRTALTDWIARHPRARAGLYRLMQNRERRGNQSMVVRLGPDSSIDLEIDLGGSYRHVTGIREHSGYLYLAGLVESTLARVKLPEQ
jgi:sugar lactone lactonase YvrE